MTNREILMEALRAVDDEKFDRLVLSRMSNLPEKIDELICDDCAAEHMGCTAHYDDGCCMDREAWMGRESRLGVEAMIGELEGCLDAQEDL